MAHDLDDIKRRIGADRMDESEQKQLFNKFRDHGGQVIKDRDFSDREARQSRNAPAASGRNRTPSPAGSGRSSASQKNKIPGERRGGLAAKLGRLISRFKLYLRSVFGGVMDGSGNGLSPKFIELLHGEVQHQLVNLQLLVTPLAHAPIDLKEKLQAILHREGAYYYELILRMDQIYDETDFREILLAARSRNGRPCPPESLEVPLKRLYKKLYALRRFNQSCNSALTRGLEIQADHESKEKVALKKNIQRGRKAVNYLFNQFLPKLHLAILNIVGGNFPMGHRALNRYLEITDEDTVGSITETLQREMRDAAKKQHDTIEQKREAIKKEEESKEISVVSQPDNVQAGLALMREIPLSKKSNGIPKDSPLQCIPATHKMYLTQLYLQEMENEYLFLLTSNKVNISMEYQAGKRTNIKQEFSDIYLEFQKIRESFEEYNKNVVEQQRVQKSTQYSFSQKSQMLHKLTMQISTGDNTGRRKLAKVLYDLLGPLKRLLDDQSGDRIYLQNPDDPIHFEINFGGKKKLDGKRIIEGFQALYRFTSAFHFRLQDGDLAGYGAPVEMTLVFGDEQVTALPGEEDEEQTAP